MIEVKFTPSEYKLEVSGHAGYAETGKDIICSAVSILFYTLAQSLSEARYALEEDPVVNVSDGVISCAPQGKYEATVGMIFWTILNGIQLLAEDEPDYVHLEVVGVEEG